MSATRVKPAYINGTGASAVPDNVARSEVFYEKLLQLHKDAIAGKNPRLTLAQAPSNFQSRNANSTTVPAAVAHTQAENTTALPGLNNQSAAQPFASSTVPFTGAKPSTSTSSTPAKLNSGLPQKNDTIDEPLRLKRIKEARQKLERAIAEYAKADEPILKNAREIPLNLLALAHAQVAPVSGIRGDSSEASFDDDSYYSSKANSWSTEHTEPQLGQTDAAIVISDGDEDDLYEPPSQVDAALTRAGQPKVPGIQHFEPAQTNGDWEPDWDDEDDYEPPATTAFGGSAQTRSAPQHPANSPASHHAGYGQTRRLPSGSSNPFQPPYQPSYGTHMPTIAVNQIPAPAAPQPSRISTLTTGNLTQTMQSQISSIQQAQGGSGVFQSSRPGEQHVNSASSAKELKKARRLAKKEAKAAAADPSKKRKRGQTPERQQDKKGKRRAVLGQQGTPEPYIKPEPTSPPSGLAAIPSRRPSVVYRNRGESTVQSSPHSATRPRSAYISDQDHSPRGRKYADPDTVDRLAMPPPKPVRRTERDSQDLRRVASLQYARRPVSPAHEYASYTEPRAPSRYEYAEPPISRGSTYREGSMRPPTARPARTPSPGHGAPAYDPRYSLPAPRPGEIVTDAYGNRYIAELVPDDHAPPSRSIHPADYYPQYPTSRRAEVYEDDTYRMPPPTRSRAYSHIPEPAVDRRSRAYSHVPEPALDPRVSHRAYSVHPTAVPQHRELHEAEDAATYDRRSAASRYEDQTSPRAAAYTSEYSTIPRAYSVRPDAARRDVLPDYSSARAGSMAPAGYARRGEMAPPALPVMRSRDAGPGDDGYRYAVASSDPRGSFDDRRVASYRY